jgi:hypothetical protein
MLPKEKLLEMLSGEHNSLFRLDACRMLRSSPDSSPEIVEALIKASHDTDEEVAHAAINALNAEVHREMVLKMGLSLELDIPTDHQEKNSSLVRLQIGQSITFLLCVGILLFSIYNMSGSYSHGEWTWTSAGRGIITSAIWRGIFIGVYLLYIGLQVYAILKYGLIESFAFLAKILDTIQNFFD